MSNQKPKKMKISKAIAAPILFVLMFFLSTGNGFAIPFRSQEDSLDCLQKLSVASLALEKEMYAHAIEPWKSLFENCPDVSVRIYSDGVKLWEYYIENAEDESVRQAYVDTLLMVYDKRLKYFGEYKKYPEGWIVGRKGIEIVKYRRNNHQSLKEAYDYFSKSYSLRKEKSEPAVLVAWMQSAKILNDEGLISDYTFINDYISVIELVENKQFQQKYNSKISQKINEALTSIIQRVNIDDCQVFSELFESSERMEMLTSEEINIYQEVMEMTGCRENDFFTVLVEKKYELNPSPNAALDLARMFVRKQRFDNAAEFYHDVASKSPDDSLKAVGFYELAVLTDGHYKKPVKAREYAKRSSSLMPDWGQPHLLMGSIYAREAVNISGNDFEKNAVYWVAVDQFLTAMRKDNSCKGEAERQIDAYAQYFPDKQTCFFHGLDEGQEFIVGDWINEPTTVRYR
jgi:hypothetical protein